MTPIVTSPRAVARVSAASFWKRFTGAPFYPGGPVRTDFGYAVGRCYPDACPCAPRRAVALARWPRAARRLVDRAVDGTVGSSRRRHARTLGHERLGPAGHDPKLSYRSSSPTRRVRQGPDPDALPRRRQRGQERPGPDGQGRFYDLGRTRPRPSRRSTARSSGRSRTSAACTSSTPTCRRRHLGRRVHDRGARLPGRDGPPDVPVRDSLPTVAVGQPAPHRRRRRPPTSVATRPRSRPTRSPIRPSTRRRSPTRSPPTSRSSSSSRRRSSARAQQCGPTLDQFKPIAAAHPDVTFINVEPYQLKVVDGPLQPVLDANGQLQATDVTDEWGLLSEPWIFAVDRTGSSAGLVRGHDHADAELDAILPVISAGG